MNYEKWDKDTHVTLTTSIVPTGYSSTQQWLYLLQIYLDPNG